MGGLGGGGARGGGLEGLGGGGARGGGGGSMGGLGGGGVLDGVPVGTSRYGEFTFVEN